MTCVSIRALGPWSPIFCRPACRGSLETVFPAFETVNEKYVISDGVRTMDLYPVLGLGHSGTMLVAYLPAERILINARPVLTAGARGTTSLSQPQHAQSVSEHSAAES